MKRTADPLLDSYFELIQTLVGGCRGVCVLDGDLEDCGSRGSIDTANFSRWIGGESATPQDAQIERARKRSSGTVEIALGLADSTGKRVAIVGIALSGADAARLGGSAARTLRQRLKPALDCLHRELSAAARNKSKVATLSEKTRDLEWLFEVAAELRSAASNRGALEKLLATATQRMRSAYAAVIVPGHRLTIDHARTSPEVKTRFAKIRAHVQPRLLDWARRHRRPLVVNRVGSEPSQIAPCKLLSVPVSGQNGKALGVLVFMNGPSAPDYIKRQSFLAAHIMRQAAQLLQSQYDLSTGLLTRSALEETYSGLPQSVRDQTVSVLHIDIDRLHVINNVHGFSAGDDIIVRLAQLLSPPLLPQDALVARMAGDQFAAVLPACDSQAAAGIAAKLQKSIHNVTTSAVAEGIEVTLSCGITTLTPDTGKLTAGLAAAEAACGTAKERGRNRVEIYTVADQSIIQRHGETFKAWSLEEALRNDQFVLFAQRIVPLGDPELPSGFEVLLRLKNPDGSLGTPADFLAAAQRYQLMPAIDRWVLDHVLAIAESQGSVLARQRISLSINVTAESLRDDKYVDYLLDRIRGSRFPSRLLTVEITEQSALRNMARAVSLMKRLREAGFGVALDDFGTGTNSLVYLRDLPVTRVKIDGSFVRDIDSNRRSESTLRGILELLKPFDVETVAEFVENDTVARKAGTMGCDYGQGYAFGAPQPLAEAISSLKADESRKLRRLSLEI